MKKLFIFTFLLLCLIPIVTASYVVTASYDKNFILPLANGWNLVSTPLILEDSLYAK